jgi:tRNA threonylcarbamoyladenosine biosynthesis protein TsaB
MTLLALDSACAACSVALWRDGEIRAHRFEQMPRGHAEALMPMVVATLGDAGTGFGDLESIAVTVGPGSFTGIRTGLAAARGLALARAVPVVGFTTLETVAFAAAATAAADTYEALVIALETGRSDLYVQCFAADLTPLSDPASLAPDRIAATLPHGRLLGYGDGMSRLDQPLNDGGRPVERLSGAGLPDAADLAQLAASRSRGSRMPAPVPFYLHAPHVRLPAKAEVKVP